MSRLINPHTSSIRVAAKFGSLAVVAFIAACGDEASRPAPTAPSGAPALAVNNGANNRRILFQSNRYDPSGMEIFSMNPDGSGLTRLTSGPGNDAEPAWSPDGKRVAFVSTRHEQAGAEIYVMNADGTGVTRLTNSVGWDLEPTWSKDGKRIAFASTRDAADPTSIDPGDTDIYVMNADGSGVTRLTSTPGVDSDPSWSADGKQIAFVSGRDFLVPTLPHIELYVMNIDGSQVSRITYENGSAAHPSWAPGGKQIAFDLQAQADPLNIAVYTVNADGTGLTRLTNGNAFGGDLEPSWSPDGKQLAFVSVRDGIAEIYRMNADGTGQTRLTSTSNKLSNLAPAWNR